MEQVDEGTSILLVIVDEAGRLHATVVNSQQTGRLDSGCSTAKKVTYRAVEALDVRWLIQLHQNVLREHFSKLDTDIVCCAGSANTHICTHPPKEARTEQVDALDDAFREDRVFEVIERNERGKHRGHEQQEEDAVSGRRKPCSL